MLDFFAEFGHCAKYKANKKPGSGPAGRHYSRKVGTGPCLSEGHQIPHFTAGSYAGFIDCAAASKAFARRNAAGSSDDEEYMSYANMRARRLRNRVPGTMVFVTSLNDLFNDKAYTGLKPKHLELAEEIRQYLMCV